jgi:branched-chain amino acid transport system permease protein
MTEFAQQLINGLSLGAIYALIALGYTMVYGVLRFINFAHSDVFMVGSFAGFYIGRGMPKESFATGFIALAGAMVVCAVLGVVIERLAYRPLRNRSKLTVLITAIGVSLLLENTGQFVFGAAPKAFPTLFPTHSFKVQVGTEEVPVKPAIDLETTGTNAVVAGKTAARKTETRPKFIIISSNQLVVLVVALALLGALQYIVLRTKVGTAMRAVSFNPQAASLVGINNDRIISFTFALGSALAAAGGILYSLNYQAIDPLMGVLPGLKAFVAAVLGGIGNIPGAALGGLLIGVVETFVNGSRFSTFTDAIAFAILIAILLFRPAGLLGKMQVEKV